MFALRLRVVLALVGSAVGACAAPTDLAETEAAATGNSAFDAVVAGGPRIETDRSISARQSASTRLLGFVPGREPAAVADTFADLGRWTELRTSNGKAIFSGADVLSDERGDPVRRVSARMTVQKILTIDLSAEARAANAGAHAVSIVSTSSAGSLLLGGTVIEKGNLSIEARFVPYEGGVIVDAEMRVKTKKHEEKSAELTETIGDLFRWVAKAP